MMRVAQAMSGENLSKYKIKFSKPVLASAEVSQEGAAEVARKAKIAAATRLGIPLPEPVARSRLPTFPIVERSPILSQRMSGEGEGEVMSASNSEPE